MIQEEIQNKSLTDQKLYLRKLYKKYFGIDNPMVLQGIEGGNDNLAKELN